MKRNLSTPRKNWQQEVEAKGFIFHTPGETYWDESVSYSFTMEQILELEKAANECHEMCLKAVQHVIDNDLFDKFHIPRTFVPKIIQSWDNDDPAIYGRFDFSYDGINKPKMLEYNADTPTSLLEAAIIQWYWLEQVHPGKDQFNSLHEKLVAYWTMLKPYLKPGPVHFACLQDNAEDLMTTGYMMDTASQAGLDVALLHISDVGWNEEAQEFRDLDENKIENLFKLYPWEWMMHEEFGVNILKADTFFIEPTWKMILSNKAILPILWELFPNNEYLLASYFEGLHYKLGSTYVKKPLLSREGANVEIVEGSFTSVKTEGEYGEEGYIYQELQKLPEFDGNYPVLGVWTVGGEAAGMGIREDKTAVTGNMSRYIPHFIEG